MEHDDTFPPPLANGDQTHQCYATILPIEHKGKVYTDQTGRFPVPSSQGNNYVFVYYCQDSNYIHFEPIKNQTANELLAAYKRSIAPFIAAGFRPKLHILDNECSNIMKELFCNEKN